MFIMLIIGVFKIGPTLSCSSHAHFRLESIQRSIMGKDH
jgi:hypothetical protein